MYHVLHDLILYRFILPMTLSVRPNVARVAENTGPYGRDSSDHVFSEGVGVPRFVESLGSVTGSAEVRGTRSAEQPHTKTSARRPDECRYCCRKPLPAIILRYLLCFPYLSYHLSSAWDVDRVCKEPCDLFSPPKQSPVYPSVKSTLSIRDLEGIMLIGC
jgi:hypothetical protein